MVTAKNVAGVLIIVLSFVLCIPAKAQGSAGGGLGGGFGPIGPSTGTIVGAVVGVVAAVIVVTILAIHYSKKRTITGCVISGTNGMSVTDEKDRRSYTLSGNTTGIKPGDRMRLQGKKIKPKDAGNSFVWETKEVAKDFGGCQP